MDWWLFTFFIGAILSLFLPIVPALFQLFILLFVAIAFFYSKRLKSSSGFFFGSAWILFSACFFLSSNEQVIQQFRLTESAIYKQGITVQGEVVSLHGLFSPNLTLDEMTKQRFVMKVSHINQQILPSTIFVRLTWQQAPIVVAQGQVFQLKVKVKPTHGLANLGTFNYKAWLTSKSIALTGYVITNKTKQRSENYAYVKRSQSWRQDIFHHYQLLVSKAINKQQGSTYTLLYALAFGERQFMSQSQWQVLQATGTSHLIAISGLHVGLVAAGAFSLTMLFFRLFPFQPQGWQVMNIRLVIT